MLIGSVVQDQFGNNPQARGDAPLSKKSVKSFSVPYAG